MSELPPPPSTRVGPAVVWTGHELVVWGGAIHDGEVLYDDGFAFDAETRRWAPLPPAPLSPRYFPAAVWTGREVLIWGGWDGANGYFADGAAYDPASGSWRSLPPTSLSARSPLGAVWTGTEMIVWGTGPAGPDDLRDVTGAAYDPASDTWTPIGDGPFPVNWGSVVWTGEEMVVVGASVRKLNTPETPTAVAAAYDPASDRWQKLPAPDLDPNGTFAEWTGRLVMAVDYNHEVRAYERKSNRWGVLPSIPLRDGEDWPDIAAAQGELLADTFGGFAVYRPQKEAWAPVDVPPVRGWLYLVPAGDVVVLWEADQDGQRPDSLLVWKPS